ncbi:hypothetical protein PAXINDRAFT_102181 [Paxillus involutus ATCC 200175]|uniref:LIM zinc-binding domain-containing protein n=1 Tax=Paxillus involutus ATCC 200175 TaxID=664439 RepID=A0A0C9TRH4_PAXIN|nr:hypothetical protein PAXINDRAFT_102181 [Paxillus involutus ATCC 200175]
MSGKEVSMEYTAGMAYNHQHAYARSPIQGQQYHDPRLHPSQRLPLQPQSQQQSQQQSQPQSSGFQYTNQLAQPRQPHHPLPYIAHPRPHSQPFFPPPPAHFSQNPPNPPQHPQHVQVPTPPSPFPSPSNPSPRHLPQSILTTGPSRRPLPNPKSRPESMPPPPRHTQPPLIQAPAPSRPAILTHSADPSTSSSSGASSFSSTLSSTSPTIPVTAPGGRRPLPTPVLKSTKHASLDLRPIHVRPTSPVKSILTDTSNNAQLDRGLPSSFTRRIGGNSGVDNPSHGGSASSGNASFTTPPLGGSRTAVSEAHQTQRAPSILPPEPPTSPNRFVPLWKRNLPAASPAPNGTTVMERRSTVSGAVPAGTPLYAHGRAESPERRQPASPQQTQLSPSRRPLPSSPPPPARQQSIHQRIAASSGTDDDLDADLSSPSDVSTDIEVEQYEPMTFADPLEEEEEELEDRHGIARTRTPSPQYGIRDLPHRSRVAIAGRLDTPNLVNDNGATVMGVASWEQEQAQRQAQTPRKEHQSQPRMRPVRSATLPRPPTSSSALGQEHEQGVGISQSPRATPASSPFADRGGGGGEHQSLTLRFASLGLAEERERERQRGSASPTRGTSPTRGAGAGPTSPTRQQQGWPTNVPPLPRTPGSTSQPFFGVSTASASQPLNGGPATGGSPHVPPSSFRSPALHSQSPKPNGIGDATGNTSSPAPAPLPRTTALPSHPFSPFPKPATSFSQPSERQPQPQPFAQLSERQRQKQRERDLDVDLDDAPPPSLRRSPSPSPSVSVHQRQVRAPAIEITNDTPPRREWTPSGAARSSAGDHNGYGGIQGRAGSPTRRGQPLPQPRPQPQPQAQAQPRAQMQLTEVPMISLPGDHHDNEDDEEFGPGIVVCGPGAGSAPSISFSVLPSISVSEPGPGAPNISVSSAGPPSISFSVPSPPQISVSDSPNQPRRRGPLPGGNFGSRHTQIQESSFPSSHAASGPGPGSKRVLPPPPSSYPPSRTNGLSCGGCNGPIIGRISFTPRCFHCKTAIIDERFITLDDPALGKRTYHEQHFFCAECGDPFLAPSSPALSGSAPRTGELNVTGDGEFADDDVGFTVYKGHPYCEACHVRLRMPKCKGCKKSIRDGVRAIEALGGKWCWRCFVCEGCKNPFEDPSFFQRDDKPFCEPCFSLMLRNEV